MLVLDPTTIGTDDVAMRFDLPGGAGRLYAESHGIDHVLVNGEAIVADGALTDVAARAGAGTAPARRTRPPRKRAASG